MRYGSLFRGIGGFDRGLDLAGMECAWQVEIDAAANRVAARHWPLAKQFTDVRTVGAHNLDSIDLICGGFPCQDLSVAGKRAGLDGERSGLWFEFHRILAELKPGWCLIENVPGLLSSNGGRDFAVILSGLVQLGYGVCWRVLDSQYFGLAQRRERVFVVGHLGDGRAAEVLFEPESLRRDSAPSRQKGQGVAASLTSGSHPGSNAPGRRREDDVNLAYCLTNHHGRNCGEDTFVPAVAGTLGGGSGQRGYANSPETCGAYIPVAHALTADGFDASEDGSGRGTPLVPVQGAVAYDLRQITSKENRSNPQPGDPSPTMHEQPAAVAFSIMPMNSSKDFVGRETDVAQPLMAGGPVGGNQGGDFVLAGTLSSAASKNRGLGNANESDMVTADRWGVRRLMPIECERLQGFPDGHTEGQADSPRYKQLGNAVSVPPAEWIARRIVTSEAGRMAE